MSAGYDERALWYAVEQTLLDDTHYLRGFVDREGASVLEIPCAAGRNLSWLGGLDKRVVLADSSQRMLEVCQAKADRLGLNIETLLANMEDFQLAENVDTVIVPQDGFLLLSGPRSMLKALRRICENLNVTGRALIDLPLLEKCNRVCQEAPLYFDEALGDDVEVFEWSRRLPNGNMMSRWRTQRQTANASRYQLGFRYEIRNFEEQLLESYNADVELTIVNVGLMKELISASGLQVEAIHQNYAGGSLTKDSCRAIFQLRRP